MEFLAMKMGFNMSKLAGLSPKEAEEKMAKKDGDILAEGEHIILAYKFRQNKLYFTDRRVIVKTAAKKTPIQMALKTRQKKQTYNSIPYSTIGAWEIQTAGALDADCELILHTANASHTLEVIKFDLLKSKASLNHIAKVLNHFVLPGNSEEDLKTEDVPIIVEKVQGVRDWLSGNAMELETGECEKKFKELGILHRSETVRKAYRSGRDTTLFTNKRFLFIDVKGLISKRVCYTSMLYNHVQLYEIQTGANSIFDSDAEFFLYTDLPDFGCYKQDIKKSIDLVSLQTILTDLTCGTGTVSMTPEASTGDMGGAEVSTMNKLFGGDGNMGQVSAADANTQFHTAPNNILQNNEIVEMALKGKKDYWLFTSKRLVKIDNKGGGLFSAKKTSYLSIPYGSISHFAIQTPGGGIGMFKDKDAEMQLWTTASWVPGERDANGVQITPPMPSNAYIEQDLAPSKVDLTQIHRLLSEKLLNKPPRAKWPYDPALNFDKMVSEASNEAPQTAGAIPMKAKIENDGGFFGKLGSMFSNNYQVLDAPFMEKQFKDNRMLQEDEQVAYAFNCGRDILMLTTKRIFLSDSQGWSGKKVQYLSIPYSTVCNFGCITASKFDNDTEMYFDLGGQWNTGGGIIPKLNEEVSSRVTFDLKKINIDMSEIFYFLSDRLILHRGDNSQFKDLPIPKQPAKSMNDGGNNKITQFMSFFDGNNMSQLTDAECADNTNLLSGTFLLPGETIEIGFRKKKDLILFTNLRLLSIDHQKQMMGLLGAKYVYESTSWESIQGFGQTSAGGMFDTDSEMWLFREGPSSCYDWDIRKGAADINQINKWINDKIFIKRKNANRVTRLTNNNLYNLVGGQQALGELPENQLPA